MIGELRDRIGLLAPSSVPDEGGGASLGWSLIETVPAAVEERPSRRSLIAGGEILRRRLRITLRRHSTMTPEFRLAWQGRTFRILSITAARGKEHFTILDTEEIAR